MTSLNNFKMAEKQVDEPVIPPNLDTMLGNLQVLSGREGWDIGLLDYTDIRVGNPSNF